MIELNKELVDKARETIEQKRPYWEKKLNVKFDKDGRVKMGVLSTFDETDFNEIVRRNISKEFSNCFTKALKELNIEPFPLENLTFEDYKRKRITVTTTKGRTQEKNIAAFLQKAHEIWEKEREIYRPFRVHMRDLRPNIDVGSREQEMRKVMNILANMERGNTYIAYDKLLREFQERPLYISINPLDKLYSSGTKNGYRDTLTRFDSCWSNKFEKTADESYTISPMSCYSNPKAQIVLGSHISSCMVMLPNGSTQEIDGMTFHGMAQRSHAWLYDDGLFIENMYPDKYNLKRLNEINRIIGAKTTVINNLSRWVKVQINDEDVNFNQSRWFNDLNSALRGGNEMYLDRSGVNRDDGGLWINPNFRLHAHRGSMWTPSGEC